MKALKLKSSPDDNPVWGQVMIFSDEENFFLLETPSDSGKPYLFSDPSITMDMIRSALHPASDPLDDFELVDVEILVKR